MARITITYDDGDGNVTIRAKSFDPEANKEFEAAAALHRALVILDQELLPTLPGDPYRSCIQDTKSADMRAKLARIDSQEMHIRKRDDNNEGWNNHGYWVGKTREPHINEVTNFPSRARCGGPKMCRTCGWGATIFPKFVLTSERSKSDG